MKSFSRKNVPQLTKILIRNLGMGNEYYQMTGGD